MSSPLAGKFQDHYEVLGVDPKSDSETIQNIYAKLAQKYSSDNPDTADPERFEAINMAYEILSEPALRREFDKIKGIDQEEGGPKFSGPKFFSALGRELGLRATVLCLLYDRRRINPFKPSLSMRHVEGMLDATIEELSFALWYLKQRSFVASDDKSSLQITVEGMDFLENNRPSPEIVMPFIKQTALPAAPISAPPTAPVAQAQNDTSVRIRLGARVVGLLKNPSAAPGEAG